MSQTDVRVFHDDVRDKWVDVDSIHTLANNKLLEISVSEDRTVTYTIENIIAFDVEITEEDSE